MKKIEKVLLSLFLVAVVFSLAYAFYKTVIRGDFSIVNTEPTTEQSQ
ncbi:MAG: hypothetical protein WC631_03095 [Candidatus Paceibacterota bacterium]|jgi:hypothetical protein